jgi:hypothetical protein
MFFSGTPSGYPETALVEAARTGGGGLAFVSKGHFMYRKENLGLWSPADLPVEPRNQLMEEFK